MNLLDKKITVPTFCSFLYRLLIFIAVFDGIRSRMLFFGEEISALKEISTFTLLTFIIARVGMSIKKKDLFYCNLPFLLYLVVAATIFISINDIDRSIIPAIDRPDLPSSYAIHFKNIESFILVFVMLNYEMLTNKNMQSLLAFFVSTAVGYVVFTVVVYFLVDLSFLFQAPWYGRISIGYPTSDTQILCFALGCLLFIDKLFTTLLKVIFMLILIIGVLMNATATGMITLVILFSAYAVASIFNGNILRLFYARNLVIIILLFLTGFGLQKFTTAFSDRLETFYSLFDTKYNIASGKLSNLVSTDESDEEEDNGEIDYSERVRGFQIEKAFFYGKDKATMLLGGPISIGTTIENENYFLLRSYGYIGLVLYYGWLASLVFIATRNILTKYGQLLLLSITILFITNFAIITTYLFGIAAPFALLISYCVVSLNKKKEESYLNLAYQPYPA